LISETMGDASSGHQGSERKKRVYGPDWGEEIELRDGRTTERRKKFWNEWLLWSGCPAETLEWGFLTRPSE